jgi:hypothetical protein
MNFVLHFLYPSICVTFPAHHHILDFNRVRDKVTYSNHKAPYIYYRVPIHPIFHKLSRFPGFISNDPLFKCSSVTISMDNYSVMDTILCNWHFYNDVNTPGGQSTKHNFHNGSSVCIILMPDDDLNYGSKHVAQSILI